MRISILTSVLALAVAFTGITAFASEAPDDNSGEVIQRRQRPLPQPELPEGDEYQDQGQDQSDYDYQGDEQYNQEQTQIQNNIIIENPGYQGYGPHYRLPFQCVTCFVDYNPQFTTVVAVGPNGRAQIVFANFPGYANEILINEVERMKAGPRGICRNLILNQQPCNGGCGGNGGGVLLPPPIFAQPHYQGPRGGYYPPRRGGGNWIRPRGNGPRPLPRR